MRCGAWHEHVSPGWVSGYYRTVPTPRYGDSDGGRSLKGSTMQLSAFTSSLPLLSDSDIRLIAKGLDALVSTPEEEVAWWRATMAVDRVLRRAGQSRTAAQASQAASVAVKTAAEAAGMTLPDSDVTRVARAAGAIARAIVAGPVAAHHLELFLAGWEPYLPSPAGCL